MADILEAKNNLMEYIKSLNRKYELSETVGDDYFEPGMMENLEQYKGEYDEVSNTVIIRVEAKGLRYDNRTQNLEKISIGDAVDVVRDPSNPFNSNNFMINKGVDSLGNLPADLCNVLAPLYDSGYAAVISSKVSYIEKLRERSRYAKQGVMFVEIEIKLRGV